MTNHPPEPGKDTAMLNTPEEAVRLLKTIGYTHDEIVDAIVKQFGLTRGKAEILVSA